MRTPHGPATVHVVQRAGGLEARAWGPGADWALEGVPALAGLHRPVPTLADHHPSVTEAQRRHPGLALGASRSVLHALVPAILGQRVTGGEAVRSWAGICRALGERAPGPFDLLLPPAPDRLASRPSWWFHRFGVERRRADAIVRAARHARRMEEIVDLPMAAAYARLQAVPGIGPGTAAEVAATALGDLDAVSVGDYHLKNVVAHALAGEPRGTDERMLELLAPWAGHRAVVVRLLVLEGPGAPVFGPRQRIVPIARL
jgi:3-methyladenine DNA glycosylase/8-oxoguanine DNA glycosylase